METYSGLTDGKTYTVVVAGSDAVEFTATDGVIDDVAVSTTTIVADTVGTPVKAQLLDKNDVVVEEYAINDTLPGKIEYSITSANGYTSDDKLVLPEVGNTATAKIVYHSFKYDTTGKEIDLIEKTFTITAVADDATTSNWNYTLTNASVVNWKTSVTKNTELATNDTLNAFFYFVNSNKVDVTASYSVESSDNSILLLANQQLVSAGSTNGSTAVTVTGVNPGTAYINVVKDGKVVTSLPVTVKAARKLTDIKFGKADLYSSIDSGVTEKDETSIKGYDQYGAEYGVMNNVTAVVLNAPANARPTEAKNATITISNNNGKLDPAMSGWVKGDYLVKVSATVDNVTVSRTMTLHAVDTAAITASNYDLVLSDVEMDIAVSSSTAPADYSAKNLTATVKEFRGKAPVSTVAGVNYSIKKPNGTTVTGSSISFTTWSNSVVTKMGEPTGTYVITATARIATTTGTTTKTFTKNFTLKDSQTKAVADVIKISTLTGISASSPANVDTDVKNALTGTVNGTPVARFYYDGIEQTSVTSTDIDVPTDSAKINGKALYIGTVNVNVTTVNGITVSVPVDINRTFILD